MPGPSTRGISTHTQALQRQAGDTDPGAPGGAWPIRRGDKHTQGAAGQAGDTDPGDPRECWAPGLELAGQHHSGWGGLDLQAAAIQLQWPSLGGPVTGLPSSLCLDRTVHHGANFIQDQLGRAGAPHRHPEGGARVREEDLGPGSDCC